MAQYAACEEKTCRICFEDGKKEGLISPCVCTGSGRYVHNTCLLRWLDAEPERGRACTVCLEELATGQNAMIEHISKGPKIIGELRYFDTLWQIGIALCQLYTLLWITYFYKAPYMIIEQVSRGLIVGNQTVFVLFGLQPWAIRNKKAYMRLMGEMNETWYIFVLYTIAMLASFHTPWGGILVVNVVSTQILEYHHRMLEEINKNIGVAFVDRPIQ